MFQKLLLFIYVLFAVTHCGAVLYAVVTPWWGGGEMSSGEALTYSPWWRCNKGPDDNGNYTDAWACQQLDEDAFGDISFGTCSRSATAQRDRVYAIRGVVITSGALSAFAAFVALVMGFVGRPLALSYSVVGSWSACLLCFCAVATIAFSAAGTGLSIVSFKEYLFCDSDVCDYLSTIYKGTCTVTFYNSAYVYYVSMVLPLINVFIAIFFIFTSCGCCLTREEGQIYADAENRLIRRERRDERRSQSQRPTSRRHQHHRSSSSSDGGYRRGGRGDYSDEERGGGRHANNGGGVSSPPRFNNSNMMMAGSSPRNNNSLQNETNSNEMIELQQQHPRNQRQPSNSNNNSGSQQPPPRVAPHNIPSPGTYPANSPRQQQQGQPPSRPASRPASPQQYQRSASNNNAASTFQRSPSNNNNQNYRDPTPMNNANNDYQPATTMMTSPSRNGDTTPLTMMGPQYVTPNVARTQPPTAAGNSNTTPIPPSARGGGGAPHYNNSSSPGRNTQPRLASALDGGSVMSHPRRGGGVNDSIPPPDGYEPPANGDWVWDLDNQMFWSEKEYLFLNPKDGHFFDPDSQHWFNPDSETWYPAPTANNTSAAL